jgi:phospholipid transport system substrate-binding protein
MISLLQRRSWLAALALGFTAFTLPALAAEAPDAMVKRLSTELLNLIKTDPAIKAGDQARVMAVVDEKIMPNVNFDRMSAAAVGRHWRQATPEQQKRLQSEFKAMLVRTYSGALGEVGDQTLAFKPLRMQPTDTEVVVRSEVRGRGEPIQLDYRMEKSGDSWKIYDLNVMGLWMVETYRTQFAQEINAKGIDGLIESLAQRNKGGANGGTAAKGK